MKKASITVLHQTDSGLNDKLLINHHICNNNEAYNKAKMGKLNGYCGVRNENNVCYIRSNPNGSKKDNLDK
jgi:hypothetical protein